MIHSAPRAKVFARHSMDFGGGEVDVAFGIEAVMQMPSRQPAVHHLHGGELDDAMTLFRVKPRCFGVDEELAHRDGTGTEDWGLGSVAAKRRQWIAVNPVPNIAMHLRCERNGNDNRCCMHAVFCMSCAIHAITCTTGCSRSPSPHPPSAYFRYF